MEKLDEILLQSEASRELTAEDINSIFRIMHTTKSSSAIMGLDSLQATAHRLEDLFSELRDDPGQMKKAEEEIFELLFDASDFIKAELKRMTIPPKMLTTLNAGSRTAWSRSRPENRQKAASQRRACPHFLKSPVLLLK